MLPLASPPCFICAAPKSLPFASLMRAQIVPAQPPHFAAQPSDAYTSQTRLGSSSVAMDARISTSVNTLQEQTIIHDSGAIGRPHRGFLYNPNLNKSLRYKGSGGYLVEHDPLRQWGQAKFRMVLMNRWPRSASTWLPKLL
jgi:hypothetical protein